MRKHIAISCSLAIVIAIHSTRAVERASITVNAKGAGNFKTIQQALDSVPSDTKETVVILIRNGLYNEKLFIRKNHVTLVGEDKDSTRIVFGELRENWNKDNNGSDWGAAVVNIDTGVTDITIANLTVYNNYGWQNHVFNKHQFAIKGAGTRIMLLNCKVISDGGDALSLWNKEDGMYYHADCYFEGWVDFVCPRGWCYITNSQFFGHNLSASIWHDGDSDQSQKFVIRDSYFDGVPGFPLGRNHRDGQIYILDSRFSERMADRPIYRPPSSPAPWKWGARHYFYNAHRDAGDFAWLKDNLQSAHGSPTPNQVTAKWTFDGKWDPEASMPSVLPFAFLPHPKMNAKGVKTNKLTMTWIAGRNADSHRIYFGENNPPKLKHIQQETSFKPERLRKRTTYYWRIDEVTNEGVIEGKLWKFETE